MSAIASFFLVIVNIKLVHSELFSVFFYTLEIV